jgi:hypothetical protein
MLNGQVHCLLLLNVKQIEPSELAAAADAPCCTQRTDISCPDCMAHWLISPLREPRSNPNGCNVAVLTIIIKPVCCAPVCGTSAELHWHACVQAHHAGSGIVARCGWQVAIRCQRRVLHAQ